MESLRLRVSAVSPNPQSLFPPQSPIPALRQIIDPTFDQR